MTGMCVCVCVCGGGRGIEEGMEGCEGEERGGGGNIVSGSKLRDRESGEMEMDARPKRERRESPKTVPQSTSTQAQCERNSGRNGSILEAAQKRRRRRRRAVAVAVIGQRLPWKQGKRLPGGRSSALGVPDLPPLNARIAHSYSLQASAISKRGPNSLSAQTNIQWMF